uniref:Uncharacterized protein n=1 Tax=Arundo donax TaxID=35708 RepID=A0A0A9CLI7_ARUDO
MPMLNAKSASGLERGISLCFRAKILVLLILLSCLQFLSGVS